MSLIVAEIPRIAELRDELESEVRRIAIAHLHRRRTLPPLDLVGALAANHVFSPKLQAVVSTVLKKAKKIDDMTDTERAFAIEMGSKALIILEAFD